MSVVEVRRAGDLAHLIDLPERASAAHIATRLRESHTQLAEIVPGHHTVLAVGPIAAEELVETCMRALQEPVDMAQAELVEIPVVYDGPDLAEVGELANLSVEEVVARHSASSYTVAFLGFAPGFGYLVGLDERLHVPRRAVPRERVPAGTVAIAGVYSGVYPRESPGGWRLLGRTDVRFFTADREPPSLLAPGDRVRFVPL